MTPFEYISVAISIILALGITRLLTGMIDLVRYRKSVRWHWIPLVWALAILVIQFQFWWQVFALDEILTSLGRSWRNVDYIVMVLYTVALFTAGSLVLPTRHRHGRVIDLWVHFQAEGKLALLALVAYVACGVLLNIVVLGVPLLSSATLAVALIAVLWAIPMVGAFFSERKLFCGIWTLLFVIVGIAVWMLTVISQY